VAGAHGKTTVAYLLRHLLGADQRIGLIGSIAYDLGARAVPAYRTTPESLDVFGLLAQMRDAGCRQAVVEVSAEGLAQQRVGGLHFGAMVVTNLEPDAAGSATAALLDGRNGPRPKLAVVNLDDARSAELAKWLAGESSGTRVVTFGEHAQAQVRAEQAVFRRRRTSFRLVWPGGTMEIDAPLIGRRNLGNLLAAVATAWGLGRDPQVVLARLRAFRGVPGRLEAVDAGQAFDVLVDYAHSAAALRHTLADLRACTDGRLLVVFGCGGGGDSTVRAAMTAAVQAHADFAVATADNPRHERAAAIFAAMQAGVTAPAKITWIEDRSRAIGLALDLAKPGDCVVIAGKGHESFQEFADTVVPFDDRIVARELLRRKLIRTPAGGTG
jgi:UDP-N-acetylmuramoyl-L-alanyl-D-glutamate--2,6-diaminopimelate ligase